jgi:hypothetical protein
VCARTQYEQIAVPAVMPLFFLLLLILTAAIQTVVQVSCPTLHCSLFSACAAVCSFCGAACSSFASCRARR